MWPLPRYKKEYVTINFSPTFVECCWFQEGKKQGHPMCLKAWDKVFLHESQLENLTLFNQSFISQFIQQFIKKYNLSHSYAFFSLTGPAVVEEYCSFITSTPTNDDFFIKDKNKVWWDSFYLYPTVDGKFIFYVTSLKRELVFQYKLLACINNLNLVTLIPRNAALFNLYKMVKGEGFSRSQLSLDMQNNNNQIYEVVADMNLNSFIEIDTRGMESHQNEDEKLDINSALALFIAGRR